jgi:hypothetical protein
MYAAQHSGEDDTICKVGKVSANFILHGGVFIPAYDEEFELQSGIFEFLRGLREEFETFLGGDSGDAGEDYLSVGRDGISIGLVATTGVEEFRVDAAAELEHFLGGRAGGFHVFSYVGGRVEDCVDGGGAEEESLD